MITMRVMGPFPILERRFAGHSPRCLSHTSEPASFGPADPVVRLGAMGLYAAYGSNMDPAQMLRRCPSSPHTGTGWIRGWRLTFGAEEDGWEGAMAHLVPGRPAATA